MKKFIAVVALAVSFALPAFSADAAPITCPSPQVATHTADGWDCVNHGGNESGAEDSKNPNR